MSELLKSDQKELEKEIIDIVSSLKDQAKYSLANCIEENWQKTALSYSHELNAYSPTRSMEPELLKAFATELDRLEIQEPQKSKVLDSLQRRRIIQTAPHLGVTESPRMLTINWLGSLGVPDDEFYIVGMFSGIPFSNNFRPGRINMAEGSINLFPSSMQDDLVFRSSIPAKLIEVMATLPEELKKTLPSAKTGDSYTKWAVTACANIEGKILKKENLVFLDINEVVANYLEIVKNSPAHPLYRLEQRIEALQKIFPEESFFHKDNPSCPGLLITFLVISFLNEFKCFGSFRQVEYLPEYQEKLGTVEWLKEFDIGKVVTANLTTGNFSDTPWPADIIINESKYSPNPNALFGEMLLPMRDILLDR